MARAVERGDHVPAIFAAVPGIPESPHRYTEAHPDRVEKFPASKQKLLIDPDGIDDESQKPQPKQWRHELEHDTESVFWLLLYWAMVVQPEGGSKEDIDSTSWGNLIGKFQKRHALVRNLSDGIVPDNLTHSFYEPLLPLIEDLAAILLIDSYYIDASDPRSDPYYVTEAFQRVILKFMIENCNQAFMKGRVKQTLREVEEVPRSIAKPVTDSQAADSAIRSLDSGMRSVCGSVNFCLFLLLCLRVCTGNE